MSIVAYPAPAIFDGETILSDHALLVEGETVVGIRPVSDVGHEALRVVCDGLLAPGFVDLQVNGGGGVLFNESRSVDGLRRLCAAHAPFGTTALLPTLITDTPAVTDEAIAAGVEAHRIGVSGFAGLHLEGPHLSLARKGAHDPALIRPMEDADLAQLLAAAEKLPTLLTTVAVENVRPDQIAQLAAAGVVVSLGHTDAGADAASTAFAAVATMATHLFNAMSQLGSREPGLVGTALSGGIAAGLIADGIHVHPDTLALALRARSEPGRLFLVTDAMSTIGTDLPGFALNGRWIARQDGALRLPDGTLAGADLTMIDAVRFVHRELDLSLEEALRMASLYPARAIGRGRRLGRLAPGSDASFAQLSGDFAVEGTWIRGERVF